MEQETVTWTCIVPKTLDDQLNEELKHSTLKTRSEFLRDLVRRRLEQSR